MRSPRLLLIFAVGLAALALLTLRHRPQPVAPIVTLPAQAPEPAPTPEPVPLHPSVLDLLQKGGSGDLQGALVAAEKLSPQLSPSDSAALLQWTTGPRPEKLYDDAWFGLVNDVWNALRRQRAPAPELAPALIAFFRDPATPYVLRDYSIQHLGSYLEDDFAKLDTTQRNAILNTFLQAASMRSQGFAGTALYSLQSLRPQLSKDSPAFAENLAQAALALLADPAANKLARISAFQIAIENADPRALIHARRIAADPSGEPMLRAPAIAYLGRLGTSEDANLLKSIHDGCSDRRLLGALNPALAKLAASTASPVR